MADQREREVSKDEAMEELRKRVCEIRERAVKEHKDEKIDQQFCDIFNAYDWSQKNAEESEFITTSLKFLRKIIKVIALLILALILVAGISYMAVNNNPYLGKKLKNMMHDRNIAYLVARYMRKISLPLHSIIDLKQAQKWECLIQNPFYKSEEPNCELCEIPLEVYNIPAASKDARKVADRGEPCILIDDPEFKRYNYNYSFLKDFYYKNKDELDFSVCEVFGDEGDMKLSDFFKSSEEDILDSRQTFGWKNCRIEGTRVLRKLFRRPSFVPPMSEIYLEKHLFIVHKDSPTKLSLPACGTSNCFIAQVYGTSQITLTPFESCKSNCTEAEQTDLKTGEIFYYPDQPWGVTLEAIEGDLSIIYRSDFS